MSPVTHFDLPVGAFVSALLRQSRSSGRSDLANIFQGRLGCCVSAERERVDRRSGGCKGGET